NEPSDITADVGKPLVSAKEIAIGSQALLDSRWHSTDGQHSSGVLLSALFPCLYSCRAPSTTELTKSFPRPKQKGPECMSGHTTAGRIASGRAGYSRALIGSRALAAYGDVDGASAANTRPWSRTCTARLFRRSDASASAYDCAGTRSVQRASAG